MYTIGSYLQVKLKDGTKVIGRVTSSPTLSIMAVGGYTLYYQHEFEVIRQVSKSEIDFLLGESKSLANEPTVVR